MFLDALHVVAGKGVDVEVDEEHDQTGQEEADHGRDDRIGRTGRNVETIHHITVPTST